MKKIHEFFMFPISKRVEIGDIVTFELRINDNIETIIGLVELEYSDTLFNILYCDRQHEKLNRIAVTKYD